MPALDHVVVNVLHGMDDAAAMFEALGFTLTPRGHHTLGSINHLMVVPGAYLELVGLPATGRQRQELLESSLGLNGLVLKSGDAEVTRSRLASADFEVPEVQRFSRPLILSGSEVDVAFRAARLPMATFSAGRVYFCEHLTPQHVWRAEWMSHANGFCGLVGLTVDSAVPAEEAGRYARACGTQPQPLGDDRWRVLLDGNAEASLEMGAPFSITLRPAQRPRYASLALRFASLATLAERAAALPGVLWRRGGDYAATLTLTDLGLTIECRSFP